ncbi:phosphatase PAP2 family protein [Desulfatibacillum aliphaticivorans]|uniref:phosphatase PAP2 family protein n=1 Tax=Desulfatibacillum aliphaticivorans TaxID=218208 RepID=UPI0004016189|nr:phosphatase PAP2 family protein [Desulfatibacillum aliphaticivorans]
MTAQNAPMDYRKKGLLVLAGIALFLILFTALASFLDLDRKVTALFYSQEQGFFLAEKQPWLWMYHQGTLPGVLFLVGGLCLWFGGYFYSGLIKWRKYMLLVFLTGVISSGVLINGVLKPYWGRPRPVEITEFGGEWQYHNVFDPGDPGKGQSFPSGHAAMGFAFVPLLFFRKKSRAAFAGGVASLGFGVLMGATRVVQGAHFLTDVTWSGGINLFVAAALYFFILKIPEKEEPDPDRKASVVKKLVFATIFVILAFSVSSSYFTRRPIFETFKKDLTIRPYVQELVVHTDFEPVHVEARYAPGEASRLLVDSKGFGVPSLDLDVHPDSRRIGNAQHIYISIGIHGKYVEMNHSLTVILPQSLENRVKVRFETDEKPQ